MPIGKKGKDFGGVSEWGLNGDNLILIAPVFFVSLRPQFNIIVKRIRIFWL